MSNKKTVKTEKKNPLSTPLVVSMCLNAVLFLAVIIMAVYMGGNMNKDNTSVETTAPAETSAPAETQSAEAEVYSFETDAGETVEVVAAPDAYILAAEYICAGDASEWVFHYDEASNRSTLVMTMDGETTDFDINFYLTNEENARLIAELYDEATGSYSLWYLNNVLAEDEETFLGMALTNATAAEEATLLLCTPEYYEEYTAQASAEE